MLLSFILKKSFFIVQKEIFFSNFFDVNAKYYIYHNFLYSYFWRILYKTLTYKNIINEVNAKKMLTFGTAAFLIKKKGILLKKDVFSRRNQVLWKQLSF